MTCDHHVTLLDTFKIWRPVYTYQSDGEHCARNVTMVHVPITAHEGSYRVQIFLFSVVAHLLFDPAPALYFLDVHGYFVLYVG